MIDITKALAASEYQSDERTSELTWLAEQASCHHLLLEVGSWKGATACALAANTKGTLTCVDTWQGGDNPDFRKEIAEHTPDWAFEEFQRNTDGLKNVLRVRMTSLKAAQFLWNYKYDMIYLDASHDYDSVKQDILAWRPLLSPGGLLCGHDRSWDGVAHAIDELVPNHKVGAGAIWYAD